MTSLFIDDNSIHPTKGARIKGGGSWFVTKKQSHVRFLKEINISLYWRNVVIYITLTSGGTPPTKNTRSWGSMSNRDSVPGASPFWINFCSSVELWLGTVRKTFPCLPSLQAKISKLPLWPPPSLNFMNATCLAFSKFANAQQKLTTLTVMCVSRISPVFWGERKPLGPRTNFQFLVKISVLATYIATILNIAQQYVSFYDSITLTFLSECEARRCSSIWDIFPGL